MIECSGPISGTSGRGNLETRPLHGATTLRFWFDHRTIAYMTTAPLHLHCTTAVAVALPSFVASIG